MDIIKRAALETLSFFMLACGAFWISFFVVAFLQLVWRALLVLFVLALALCAYDKYHQQLKDLFRRRPCTTYSTVRNCLGVSK